MPKLDAMFKQEGNNNELIGGELAKREADLMKRFRNPKAKLLIMFSIAISFFMAKPGEANADRKSMWNEMERMEQEMPGFEMDDMKKIFTISPRGSGQKPLPETGSDPILNPKPTASPILKTERQPREVRESFRSDGLMTEAGTEIQTIANNLVKPFVGQIQKGEITFDAYIEMIEEKKGSKLSPAEIDTIKPRFNILKIKVNPNTRNMHINALIAAIRSIL